MYIFHLILVIVKPVSRLGYADMFRIEVRPVGVDNTDLVTREGQEYPFLSDVIDVADHFTTPPGFCKPRLMLARLFA